MEKAKPIETDYFGILNGRDCIYFDSVQFNAMDELIFTGEINGNLATKRRGEKKWFPYELKFKRVLAYFSCELDTYELLAGTDHLDTSDFDLIENSSWLLSLPVRSDFNKMIYKHYRLFTYDVVYDIIAVSYELEA